MQSHGFVLHWKFVILNCFTCLKQTPCYFSSIWWLITNNAYALLVLFRSLRMKASKYKKEIRKHKKMRNKRDIMKKFTFPAKGQGKRSSWGPFCNWMNIEKAFPLAVPSPSAKKRILILYPQGPVENDGEVIYGWCPLQAPRLIWVKLSIRQVALPSGNSVRVPYSWVSSGAPPWSLPSKTPTALSKFWEYLKKHKTWPQAND